MQLRHFLLASAAGEQGEFCAIGINSFWELEGCLATVVLFFSLARGLARINSRTEVVSSAFIQQWPPSHLELQARIRGVAPVRPGCLSKFLCMSS